MRIFKISSFWDHPSLYLFDLIAIVIIIIVIIIMHFLYRVMQLATDLWQASDKMLWIYFTTLCCWNQTAYHLKFHNFHPSQSKANKTLNRGKFWSFLGYTLGMHLAISEDYGLKRHTSGVFQISFSSGSAPFISFFAFSAHSGFNGFLCNWQTAW